MMRAAIFYGPGDIRVEQLEKPQPRENEVLVKVKVTGICGSDLLVYKGISPERIASCPVLGHELAGIVAEVGPGVTNLKPSDRVAVEPLLSCGICSHCRSGFYHLCNELELIGMERPGGFAEYTLAPANKAFWLPDTVSFEAASLLDCLAVSVHMMQRVGIRAGSSVAILGAGNMGLSLLQAARLCGAGPIFVTDLSDVHLSVAKEFGADAIFNASNVGPAQGILDATDGQGVDVALEAVGGTATTLGQAVEITRKGGLISYVGIFCQDISLSLWELLRKEITLVPSWSYAYWGPRREFQIAVDLMSRGQFCAQPLISDKFQLANINEAFHRAMEDDSIKVVIEPSG